MDRLDDIIRLISFFSVLIPFASYLRKATGLQPHFHFIGGLVALSLLSDLISLPLFRAKMSTALVFNLQDIVQFLLLALYYYRLLRSQEYRRIIIIGSVIYVISLTCTSLFVKPLYEYQNLMWSVSASILFIVSIAYFINLLAALPTKSITDFAPMWINSGVFFYFGFSLILFVLGNYILVKMESDVAAAIWSFHNVNNTIKNMLFALAFSFIPKAQATK